MENVKKVGFFKLGKAIKFNENSWGAIGGDCEPKQLINSIAKRNPNIEYWLLSPNDLGRVRAKEKPAVQSLFGPPVETESAAPSNVKEFHSTMTDRKSADEAAQIIKDLDLDFIFFYTGPSSTVNIPGYINKVDGTGRVKSLDFFKYYAAPIIKAMNELEKKVPIVGLLVDNRYILACKDWNDNNRPTYYLAQNTFTKTEEFFCNPPLRDIDTIESTYEYSGIETVFLLDKKRYDTDELFEMKKTNSFMMLQNQGKGSGGMDRWDPVRDYIVKNDIETDIYGKWDDDLKKEYPKWFKGEKRIETMTDELLATKYTFCVPIKEGMVTSKYAEMLHYGIIPFLHPSYDTDFNVFPDGHFIRCKSPEDLKKKVQFLNDNPEHYKKLFYNLQEKYLKDSYYTGEHVDNKIWEAYERVTNKTEINV
tara:strand:+ start:2045 stop:3307 length:1263 start_codon:yes stop_codon:yes gene_type:complete